MRPHLGVRVSAKACGDPDAETAGGIGHLPPIHLSFPFAVARNLEGVHPRKMAVTPVSPSLGISWYLRSQPVVTMKLVRWWFLALLPPHCELACGGDAVLLPLCLSPGWGSHHSAGHQALCHYSLLMLCFPRLGRGPSRWRLGLSRHAPVTGHWQRLPAPALLFCCLNWLGMSWRPASCSAS